MMFRKRRFFCALLVSVLGFSPYLSAADDVSAATPPTISIDKAAVNNGGEILVSGQAPAGKDVFVEVWSERTVRASFFDASKDLKTGAIPYRLYLSNQIPAHYRIYLPVDRAEALKKAKAEGSRWAYSRWLNDTGASAAYAVPGKIGIDVYQSSLMSSVVGSRGPKLPPLDAAANRQRSMQLIKARFRSVDKLLSPAVQIKPDGSFTAKVLLPASTTSRRWSTSRRGARR